MVSDRQEAAVGDGVDDGAEVDAFPRRRRWRTG